MYLTPRFKLASLLFARSICVQDTYSLRSVPVPKDFASSTRSPSISTQIEATRSNSSYAFDGVETKNGVPAVGSGQSVSQSLRRNSEIVDAFFATPSDANSILLKDEIKSRASEVQDFVVATRRSLHQIPELKFNEKETSAFIQSMLTQMDIPFSTGWGINTHQDVFPGEGGYGIVADIGTGEEPCILLRADMDALPILEETTGIEDFKSRAEGRMHACGHDGHSSMLLGAASILKSMEDSINGTIRLMFQPAEEGGAGGKRMVEEGVLQMHPKPQQAFAMHVWPHIPSGEIASRPGTIKAANERFTITVNGVGGHAGYPHNTVDPIIASTSIVQSLQTIVSRTLSPLESGVLSITAFQAGGEAFNVIPASVTLRGTIRALSIETLLTLRDRVEHIVTSQASVHRCNATIEYSADYYPPMVNDPELFDSFSKDVGAMLSESGVLLEAEPTMGAEDFSFVASSVPSTLFLLGQGSGTEPITNYGLHHPSFALDESVLTRGVELHVNLALRALQRLSSSDQRTTIKA